MTDFYILLISSIVCTIIGVLVISRREWDKTAIIYSSLTLLFVLVNIVNYLSIVHSAQQLLYVRLVMALSILSVYLMYVLVSHLIPRRKNQFYDYIAPYITAAVVVMSMTDFLFPSVRPSSPPLPVPGPGAIVFFIYFGILSGAALARLYRMRRVSRSFQQRQQYRMLIVGIVPVFFLAPLTSFVLPNVLGIHQLVTLTPLYGLMFAACVGYSIIRHGLFDVKLAVVRSVAYALAVATIAAAYFGFAYLISITLLKGKVTTGLSMGPLNVVLALLLVLIFQPIKLFFDRFTNRIFYRDRYDPEEFIGRVGWIVTSTSHLKELLNLTLTEIVTTMKSSGGLFIVYRESHEDVLVGKREHDEYSVEEYELLKRLVELHGPHLMVVDRKLRNTSHELNNLHKVLARKRVSIVLPLVSANETIGYLLLGEQLASGYSKRDVRALETISNELVIAIMNSRSVQVVRDLNAHLEERIESATKELRHSNERLLELDKTKDEFLSMASHQLRTPLTSVKGYISMVLEGDVGDVTPAQRQLLSEAYTSSERMVHLIADFLNVSRLQTGKFVIDQSKVNLAKIVKQEVEGIKQIAASHDIKVNYRAPGVLPDLYLDEGKIRQVIMNFIDNAIYYSPEKGIIHVKLAVEDGYVVLRIIDNGMGVPAIAQKNLFTKFFRAENARKQRPDGTGIGIYLAKKIVDGHKGAIVFESQEGKGSTFGFRLPIKKLSDPPIVEE